MIVTTFAAFAATSIILCGTFVGPDYSMDIDNVGHAHIEWSDGSSANVQFNTVFQSSNGNNIARGVTVNSTNSAHTVTGDTVNLSTGFKSIAILRPDMSLRNSAYACWAGFNRTTDQPAYPC